MFGKPPTGGRNSTAAADASIATAVEASAGESARGQFWSRRRVRFFIRIVALLQFVLIALSYYAPDHQLFSIRRGDFPAFYTGGVFAAQHRYQDLYQAEAVAAFQSELWPESKVSFHPFVYPPYVAPLLSPLAQFSPVPAQLIFFAVMLSALCLSIAVAGRRIPILGRHTLDAILVASLFAPLTSGIFASQNTALSLFFLSTALWGLTRQDIEGDIAAGLSLGVWLFKPQFPILLLFFLLFAGRFRVIGVSLLPAIAYWCSATRIYGIEWPFMYLQKMQSYMVKELSENGFQMVSFNGTLHALWAWLELDTASALIPTLAILLSVSVCLPTIYFFKRAGQQPSELLPALMLAVPTILLASPHTHYYDLGLCFLPLAYYTHAKTDRSKTLYVLLFLAVYQATGSRHLLAVTPLTLVAIACYAIALRGCLRGGCLREVGRETRQKG